MVRVIIMDLIEKAYHGLFEDRELRELRYTCSLVYSGRFSDFNAKACMHANTIEFRLSRKWKIVDDDIKIGLIQELFCKLLKAKKDTFNMQLYRIFIKNMHYTADTKDSDPLLERSFERVNAKYFDAAMQRPNLRFGKDSYRTLGSYNFHTDTITITRLFEEAPDELVDYVMHHELLHKKLQFDHTKVNAHHHTKEFRNSESEFEDHKRVEKDIQSFLRAARAARKKKSKADRIF